MLPIDLSQFIIKLEIKQIFLWEHKDLVANYQTALCNFIWILDVSGSMNGVKIQSLNYAIRNSIPAMKSVADENPNAEMLVKYGNILKLCKMYNGIAGNNALPEFNR